MAVTAYVKPGTRGNTTAEVTDPLGWAAATVTETGEPPTMGTARTRYWATVGPAAGAWMFTLALVVGTGRMDTSTGADALPGVLNGTTV